MGLLGTFNTAFSASAIKVIDPELEGFRGTCVCYIDMKIKISDVYDFDVNGKKTILGGMVKGGVFNDEEVAGMHLRGLMRAFRVSGCARLLKVKFPCDGKNHFPMPIQDIVDRLE